jgi:hypothetical protein
VCAATDPTNQVWGSTCALCAIFAWVFIPETKGLTLEQVDKMMEEVNAMRSSSWRPHETFTHEMEMEGRDAVAAVADEAAATTGKARESWRPGKSWKTGVKAFS